jgi:hypothetical protein
MRVRIILEFEHPTLEVTNEAASGETIAEFLSYLPKI